VQYLQLVEGVECEGAVALHEKHLVEVVHAIAIIDPLQKAQTFNDVLVFFRFPHAVHKMLQFCLCKSKRYVYVLYVFYALSGKPMMSKLYLADASRS